jgi:hypothetical protein
MVPQAAHLCTPSARHLLHQCLKTQRPSGFVQFRMSSYRGTRFTHAPFEPHHTQRTYPITTHIFTALPLCLPQHPVCVFLNSAAGPATATASSSLRNWVHWRHRIYPGIPMLYCEFKWINFSKAQSCQTRWSGLSVPAAGQLSIKRWGRSWTWFCELRSQQH